MAVIYLRSTDGNNADDGLSWANAKATLAAALTAAGAGGTVYVSQAHAETQASGMSLVSPGTAASPVTVLCVNDGAEPPTALATTGTVTTTGASAITFSGFAYYYGLTFACGTSGSPEVMFSNFAPSWHRMEACNFRLLSTGSNSRLTVGENSTGSDDGSLELINCTLECSNTGQGITARMPFRWLNTASAIVGATKPAILFRNFGTGNSSRAMLRGVDLSALGSGQTLVDVSLNNANLYEFFNCKLGSSVAITTGTNPGQGGPFVRLVNCDSADTNYRYQSHSYQGDIYSETTIVRTSGANDGTTSFSRKMVSSANAKFYSPLVLDDIVIWNESTGSSKTLTVEVVSDNVTFKDDELWLEVEHLGTSGFPLSSLVHDRKTDILASGTNQDTSSVTWTTTGLGTPVKQKLVATFTPQEKGPIRARVMLAKASSTVYVDPLATVA